MGNTHELIFTTQQSQLHTRDARGEARYAKDYRGDEGHVYVSSDPGSDIIDMREYCYDEPRNRQNLMQDMSALHDMPVLKDDYNQVLEDQQSLDSICENIEHSECSIECGNQDLVNAVEAARNRNFLYRIFKQLG